MIKQNRWTRGNRDFRLPTMPDEQPRHGCGFSRTTFDPDVGEEAYVLFCEDPPHARALAQIRPMTLIAHKGIAATPHGLVAYIVWQIAAGSSQESFVETFLNPFKIDTLQLVSDAANQTHLKFLTIDRSDQSVVSMTDFENIFELDHFLFQMIMHIGYAKPTEFAEATSFIMNTVEIEKLVEDAI
ncbi:MAG: hypothetical protein P1U65_10600 [Minwuia sp.]|nr:hypothetical protein [Minwuia sp.]